MVFNTLPKELALTILSNLISRDDRENWRMVCKSFNIISLEERSSRIMAYAEEHKKHNIEIISDDAALDDLDKFKEWTQVRSRSNEVAVRAARSLMEAEFGSPRRSQGTDDLGNENEDEDEDEDEELKETCMAVHGKAIADALHVYIGDQNFESHLRNLLLSAERLDRRSMAWAKALFRSWTPTHTSDNTSAFSIARLLIRQYTLRFSLEDGVVRRIQATLGDDRFRAFFRDLLMGNNEKIHDAMELFVVLEEREIWLTQDALDILKSRGYASNGYTVQQWASRHLAELESNGNQEGRIEFCKTMLITAIQQQLESPPITERWKHRLLQALCASAGVTKEAAAAQLSVILGASCTNAGTVTALEARLNVPAAGEIPDPTLVLSALGDLSMAERDVHDFFRSPMSDRESRLFSRETTRRILVHQRSVGDWNNLLLPRERMKVLAIACGLRSTMYHDLIIKAEDESQPSKKEQYMEAARAQKLGMRVHLAEWEAMVDQKGYPATWKGFLGSCCDRTEQGSREYWEGGYGFGGRRLEKAKKILEESKEKTNGELHTKRKYAQEMWDAASVENKHHDSRSWNMEWAQPPADALWTDLTEGCALYGLEVSRVALTNSDVKGCVR